ncbi:MAG: universal stress protein [Stigonema ocellatum SAG 48.90 = DSM 106950]|nr:universal stress protein [Stigonema ocellatum SAG 48.90 = DSM 106950]
MNFKRILVAINPSPLTSTVFSLALNLAQKEQANLMILYCLVNIAGFEGPIESGAMFGFYSTDPGFYQFDNETQQATAWLQNHYQQAMDLNIPTEYQHQFGDPGATICNTAQQWGASLIILGRHDQGAIAEFFTGSVSNHVVHHATCSVLVVKDHESINIDKGQGLG